MLHLRRRRERPAASARTRPGPHSRRRPSATLALGLSALTLLVGLDARAANFIVFNQTDDLVVAPDGSLRQAVRELDLIGDVDENSIFFDLPTNVPVLLEGALPDITRNVEIISDPLFGGTVSKADPELAFDILRVATGTTILDGVVLEDGPITVGIDGSGGTDPTEASEARVGFRYAEGTLVEFDQTITGLGGVIKEGLGELVLSGENDFEAGLFVTEGSVVVDAQSLPGDATVEDGGLLVFSNFDRDPDSDDQLEDEIYAGEVNGEGSVRKIGFHDLELTGVGLLQTGGTEILEGSITATPAQFPGDATIGADANLVLDVAGDETWAGNADGEGAIAKGGAGRLTLEGTHTNTLGIFVGQGSVRGAAANLPPRVELADVGTTLEIDQPTSGQFDGVITGSGPVEKHGAGTLTLAGQNDYTGGTTILQGRLRGGLASIPGDVVVDPALDGTSTLELVIDDTRTATGTYSGTGALVKSGSGRLVFDSIQPLQGAITVESGALELTSTGRIDGSVGGIGIARGGELTGEGQATGDLAVSGRVRPGSGLGTSLTAAGNATFDVDSVLDVEVQYDVGVGNQSSLLVGGTTTLEGGTVDVEVQPGDYGTARAFAVLSSGAIVETAPVQLTPVYAFVDVTAATVGNVLEVSVVENGANAVTFAQTENQFQVASALDQLVATDSLDDDVQRSLVSVTVEDLPRVLDEMGAASLSVMFTQRIESGRRFSRAVARRFTAARYEDSQPKPLRRAPRPVRRPSPPPEDRVPTDRLHGPDRMGADAPSPSPAPAPETLEGSSSPDVVEESAPSSGEPTAVEEAAPSSGEPTAVEKAAPSALDPPPVEAGPAHRAKPIGGSQAGLALWGDVFGVFGKIDGGVESEDVKTRLYGFTLGADYRFQEGGLLPEGHGLRVGGAVDYGRAAPRGERGRTETKANLFLVGGHVSWTRGPLYAGLVGRYGYMNGESSRRIVFGDIDSTALGDFDGQEGGLYTEVGARFDVGRNVILQPRAGVEWSRLSQSAFTETGAPGLNLDVDSQTIDSIRPFVIANIAAEMTLYDRFGIEPELRIGWGTELGDIDRLIDARLEGVGFSSIGAETARNEALIGAGYTMRVTRGVAISLEYDARLGSKIASHSIAAGLHMLW